MVLRLALAMVACYAALALFVFFNQRRMLYHPATFAPALLPQFAQQFKLEPWLNPAGQFIGWKRTVPGNAPRDQVLVVHGNAGSALDRADFAEGLNSASPCDVYILEYPGFGPRPGSPSQASLCEAADEALKLLEKNGPVYVIGESLGTGVASYLAGTHPQAIAAMLLFAPYHNLADVAQHHMPLFPARWMLLDRFPSAQYLRNYHGRVAVMLAGQDVVVPNRFGRALFDAYAGPKKLWERPDAGHNDLAIEPAAWWGELMSFWKSNSEQAQAKPAN